MAPLTPARALVLLTGGLTCLLTAAGGLIGALLGGPGAGLAAGLGSAAAGAAGSFLVRRRVMASFRAAQRQAGARGYAEGLAHGVLVQVAAYEAAVFPRSGPWGVTPEERAARRTLAYRMAAVDEVPESVRKTAAAALALLDRADRAGVEEAMTELAAAVRKEYARP
ncbi:hypothetical protein ACFYP4_09795 [Streptomyces sp. NPDC005551]|uniref:hypothetical protein n=1 Tax=unclassified Streptomyces TaxID=2593676 RepID=UPI0033CEAB4D